MLSKLKQSRLILRVKYLVIWRHQSEPGSVRRAISNASVSVSFGDLLAGEPDHLGLIPVHLEFPADQSCGRIPVTELENDLGRGKQFGKQ
jgi:hypothetical protein